MYAEKIVATYTMSGTKRNIEAGIDDNGALNVFIQVVGEYSGFNIIRKYDNKYDGRCFYVDLLDTNLSNLENILQS